MSQQGIYKKELTFAEQKCEPMDLLQNKTDSKSIEKQR